MDSAAGVLREGLDCVDSAAGAVREALIPGHLRRGDEGSQINRKAAVGGSGHVRD